MPVAGAPADFYVDRSSLSRRDDRVVVSELLDFRAPQSLGSATYLSARLRTEYDCRNGTARTLSAEAFASAMGGGTRVMADSQPTAPQAAADGVAGRGVAQQRLRAGHEAARTRRRPARQPASSIWMEEETVR